MTRACSEGAAAKSSARVPGAVGRSTQPTEQVAALKLDGSAPARLVWPAVVARETEARIIEPRRHWNVTTPRSVVAGLPAGGISWKLHPACRADLADPTATNPEAAPPARSTQRAGVPARRYCRRKRMNSVSRARLSPGIEPRMPTVSGWSGGLQTSMVAHRAGERRSERGAAADSARARAPAVAALTGEIRASASRHPSRRLLWSITLDDSDARRRSRRLRASCDM